MTKHAEETNALKTLAIAAFGKTVNNVFFGSSHITRTYGEWHVTLRRAGKLNRVVALGATVEEATAKLNAEIANAAAFRKGLGL
jgi:hypothetical protein